VGAEIPIRPELKIMSLERLCTWVEEWRGQGLRSVFTNGCFDLLRVGYITLLDDARREGEQLIVGINSDESVSRLKARRGRLCPSMRVVLSMRVGPF
jgi:D-beta-D-heptose 7-phosphate kinase/D-beta-D-heptose 1-phosphate adenosyltransferase